MGLVLEGGTGKGYSAGVTADNRMMVDAISYTIEHYINHKTGQAYNVLFSATPTGAGDCFLYVKNQSENALSIEGVRLHLPASEYIDLKVGDIGTPVGGSNITPSNLNAGSGNIATGVFQNGNDITGISGGVIVERIYHLTSLGSEYYNFDQDIIIPKNGVFAAYCEAGTTALAGTLVINFHDTEI